MIPRLTNLVLCSHLVFVLLSGSCGLWAASWPRIVYYPRVGADSVIADDKNTYPVSVTVEDSDGHADIADVRVLFGYTEAAGDPSQGRGYLAWAKADNLITRYGGAWMIADAQGGGRWGQMTDSWGGTAYMIPVVCSTTTSGAETGGAGRRTVTWSFKPRASWAYNPVINDADVWAADTAANIIGWRDSPHEFDVVSGCAGYPAAPHAPIATNPAAGSLDIAISPLDSGSDLFCLRLSPPVLRRDFVQPDGTLGGAPVFRSRQDWGTVTVSGLASDTAYSVKARAIRNVPGYCASIWGPAATARTDIRTEEISYTSPGITISKGVTGMDVQPKKLSAREESEVLAASVNTSMRAGGDGYVWKTRTAQWNSGTQSTLLRLRQARDRSSQVQMLTNTRGVGTGNGSTWTYTDTSAETLATLAADWVYYCNVLLQTKRQGDPLTLREQSLLDSLQWGTDEKLLQPGEAETPPVTDWEIGNEPEGPYPPPALTPADYAARYRIISSAVVAEDPRVRVGPCVMSADNGNAWLDAVFSNPSNRVDFVAYHPYGPLYWYTKSVSGGVLNADDLNLGLNWIKEQQATRRLKILERLAANGRPVTTPLIASEWNPSSWEGTYYFGLNRTVAHGLGVAETVFTFAELGFRAAQYWDLPNHGGSLTNEAPGFKVLKAMQASMGDVLLGSAAEPDLRIYKTLDSRTGSLVLWVLNTSEYSDRRVRFQLAGGDEGLRIVRERLGPPAGEASLAMQNLSADASEKVSWVRTDLTGQVDAADFTDVFPHGTLTLLRLERPWPTLPDGTPLTLSSMVVTACYPAENYLYVQSQDRSCGLRVEGDCAGIVAGDRVEIAGTLATRKPDGVTPAEAVLSAKAIKRLQAGAVPRPLSLSCRDVGGGPGRRTAGVNDGLGLSNIGLRVGIAGRVTEVLDSERFLIDDGSGVSGPGRDSGVLIRCPDASGFWPGDFVLVTGVVEGCVPAGWTVNRRFVRASSPDDCVLLWRQPAGAGLP